MATPIIDFQVLDTNDPRALLIADSSSWSFIESKPSIIEIVIPGRKAPVVTYFDKGYVNIFNSLTLAINCISGCQPFEHVDLPDGIYNITLKGSPSTKFYKERIYLRDINLRLRKDLVYLNQDIFGNDNVVKTLQDIDLYLKAANAQARYNNPKQAIALYEKAEELVEDLENCKECSNEYPEYKD